MAKRYRRLKARPGELRVRWAIAEPGDRPSLIYAWGEGCHKSDGGLLSHVLEGKRPRANFDLDRTKPFSIFDAVVYDPSLVKELEARGYDITTLQFSVQKKKEPTS